MSAEGRIGALDALRGLAIIAMVFHHFLLDLHGFFALDIPIIGESYFPNIQFPFVAIFIVVSGICCHFSRNNLRRSLIVLAAAAAVTAASFFVVPEAPIYFGILSMFGCSMLIYALFQKPLKKIPWKVGFFAFAVAFAVYYAVFRTAPRIENPYLFAIGFPSYSFASSDYYPLLPYGLLFFAGSFLGVPVSEGTAPRGLYQTRSPFLEKVGRRSLLIYILHQPVFYAVLYPISAALGR